MTPLNIANLLIALKSKARVHVTNSRNYTVYEKRDASDEMKAEVQDMNSYLAEMYASIDAILSDNYKTPFSTEQWFESKMNREKFTEPNPRLVYEKEMQENERKEIEEQIKTFKNICNWGPEDKSQVLELINKGFNIGKEGNIYDVDSLLKMGRSIDFIEFLVNEGMKLVESDLQKLVQQKSIFNERIKKEQEEAERKKREELERQKKEQEIADKKKRGEFELLKTEQEEAERKKREEFELQKKEREISDKKKLDEAEQQTIELLQRLENFKLKRAIINERIKKEQEEAESIKTLKNFTNNSFNSYYNFLLNSKLDEVERFLKCGLFNINQKIKSDNTETQYSILSLFQTRGIEFIQILIDSGYFVTNEELSFYYKNSIENEYFKKIVSVLLGSKNIDSNAMGIVGNINERILKEQEELELKKKNYYKDGRKNELKNLKRCVSIGLKTHQI